MEIEEAISLITGSVIPISDTVNVPLSDAYGYITASDIISEEAVPSFARSAMDGYAVASADISAASKEHPVQLRLAGCLMAGEWSDISYVPGSAVRVMTGAMIPDGYDAVVKQEDTDYGVSAASDEVNIYVSVPPYMNYCHIGEEIEKGSVVLKAGTRIGRTESGLLATLGMREVRVRRPARVAIISTGSELCDTGRPLEKGRIYNSIRYILGCAIRQDRLDISLEETCPDDEDTIRSSIKKALEISDIVLTTGGVSVGQKDLIPGILDSLGADKKFARVNIQPGTPTIGSILDGKVILSLSGNPYAAMANFDIYFWPVIAKLMGSESYLPKKAEAVLNDSFDKVRPMRRLVRAYEEGGRVYLPASAHMSSVFGNTAECNCYIDIPGGTSVSPGDTVKIRKMRIVY
jgi:molybdopterin molybdotransferase